MAGIDDLLNDKMLYDDYQQVVSFYYTARQTSASVINTYNRIIANPSYTTKPTADEKAWLENMNLGAAFTLTSISSPPVLPNFLSFSIDGVEAVLIDGVFTVTLPEGTIVTALVPVFTVSSGVTIVKVGETDQVSGETANDFTEPVVYSLSTALGTISVITSVVILSTP